METITEEQVRQRALDTYRVVDTLCESAYDDIVRLASMLCETPIALVSLIDRNRQWFKANTGLDMAQSHRGEAFCDHAIRKPQELMEIPDAVDDARFVDNPFVTAEDGVRFYAGMPLVTPGGAAIGTVCVLDSKPRRLSDTQRAALASLARLTMNLLESRHRELELERAALLVAATATPPPALTIAAGATRAEPACSVAIIELQDQAGVVARLGDRGLERALQQLDTQIEALLPRDTGSCVSRVSGSVEAIVVLRGSEREATMQSLRALVQEFGRAQSLRLLLASAERKLTNEPLGAIYLRADVALSQLKDEAARDAA